MKRVDWRELPVPFGGGKTMHQRLVELNEEIAARTPGYYVKANEAGKFVWSLIGPDGKVHNTRESFGAIKAVALSLQPLSWR